MNKMNESDMRKCIAIYRERMERCGGRLCEDRNYWRWEGKSKDGLPVNSGAGINDNGFVSLYFEFMCEEERYRGIGTPCDSIGDFTEKLEEYIAEYRLKSKDYEQMKLW